jgi:hypothetical protein
MRGLDRVSKICLRGQPLPDDLRKLWEANDTQPWSELVQFTRVDKLDGKFFVGYTKDDRVPPEVTAAYDKMFEHIAFIGKREDGELVGYWLGPEQRDVAASPVVELDTEGQFRIGGRNLGEYLLGCTFTDDDFTQLRRTLAGLGIKVKFKTQEKLFESFDELATEFGDLNSLCDRYQKGQDAPPSSALKFGNYRFPKAEKVLLDLGIEGITAKSTSEQVIQQVGEPDKTGGGITTVIGFVNPWIVYYRPDCQLRFEFGPNKHAVMVSLNDPNWGK